jgi:DNA polymerase III delta prime subunit
LNFERPELTRPLLERVRSGAPLLLAGPPGAGKTTLLQTLAAQLTREGYAVVSLDLMGAASSPERFVQAALGSLPAERFASRMSDALEIRRLSAAGRSQGAAAVQALFELWASLDEAGGRPVALLLDEATEIKSLAYFAGLREVAKPFAAALRARRRGTLLATSFPTQAVKLLGFERFDVPPLQAAALEPYATPSVARQIIQASFGWPRYARILLDARRARPDLAAACAHEMSPGERLETVCRGTYESLLLRSRGYGISKALLAIIAQTEGRNLTSIYREIGRSPGATRDYLGWLLGVDAVQMVKKRYYYVDGLLRHWIRLYGRGRLPTASEIETTARELVAQPQAAEPEEVLAAAAPVAEPTPRRETLIEID